VYSFPFEVEYPDEDNTDFFIYLPDFEVDYYELSSSTTFDEAIEEMIILL